jgi:hypothetical protein
VVMSAKYYLYVDLTVDEVQRGSRRSPIVGKLRFSVNQLLALITQYPHLLLRTLLKKQIMRARETGRYNEGEESKGHTVRFAMISYNVGEGYILSFKIQYTASTLSLFPLASTDRRWITNILGGCECATTYSNPELKAPSSLIISSVLPTLPPLDVFPILDRLHS